MFGIKVISGKKFDEMKCTIRNQNSIIEELREKLSNLKNGINGESVCGIYCEHCIYGLPAGEAYYPVGFGDFSKRKTFICSIAVPCKKFNRIVRD